MCRAGGPAGGPEWLRCDGARPPSAGVSCVHENRRSIFGVTNQRRIPGPAGGTASRSIRQIAPFLKGIGARAPISLAANRPMSGSWPTRAMRVAPECRARRQRAHDLHRHGLWQRVGERLRRLPRPHERARENEIEPNSERGEARARLADLRDALVREWTQRVVRIRVAPFGGNAMPDQIELHQLSGEPHGDAPALRCRGSSSAVRRVAGPPPAPDGPPRRPRPLPGMPA